MGMVWQVFGRKCIILIKILFWWWEKSTKYLCVQYIQVISNLKIPCLTYLNIKARTNECLPYLMNNFLRKKK